MSDRRSNRFLKYFPLLLDALRSTDPAPMRPAQARAWIMAHFEVAPEDLARFIRAKSKQTIFENDVHWARFFLVKARLMAAPKRGLWGLTPEGRVTHLTAAETWDLYVRVRDANRPDAISDEEDLPAPGTESESSDDVAYWFVGAIWDEKDQTARFLTEGVWETGHGEGQFGDLVRTMKPGDRIAIKASFVQKRRLPFNVGEKPVSVMRIKATGTILEVPTQSPGVKVAWDPSFAPRDWYFYTYRTSIVQADTESEYGRRLIDFAFRGEPQDYNWFLEQPYWSQKYGATAVSIPPQQPATMEADEVEDEEASPYTVENIVAEGSFFSADELRNILSTWEAKKNLILQGPPGTGKTWLAKRLGFALVGSNDRETARCRLRVVQFHPSLAYEDFVRGWRPSGDGRLSLVDGILMQSIESAASEPDRAFVLVIEEINRGNPAQIFGEMLTLLEDTKRQRPEAVELAYGKVPGERVYVPKNLYVIGTMNVADRSLAIVDLALRRRFAFVDLEPRFGQAWRAWSMKCGLEDALLAEIEARIEALNAEISSAMSLGPQFRIGHSYVTPEADERVRDGRAWYVARVETEIGPLVDEYWYDNRNKAKEVRAKLLAGII